MNNPKPTLDEYQVFVNSEETYKYIAKELSSGTIKKPQSYLLAWADNRGTMLTMLLAISPKFAFENRLNFQHGTRFDDLFVSVIGYGAFGFEITDEAIHPAYFEEKLGIYSQELADFINGVRRYL